jgi:hypothetical protein
VADPGPDGYGPPPSPPVVKIRDQFFGDGPPPHDPALAEQIAKRIREREANIPWKRR